MFNLDDWIAEEIAFNFDEFIKDKKLGGYYETELAGYKDKFIEQDFVPFPSVDNTIESIMETANSIIDGENYLVDVLKKMLLEVECAVVSGFN